MFGPRNFRASSRIRLRSFVAGGPQAAPPPCYGLPTPEDLQLGAFAPLRRQTAKKQKPQSGRRHVAWGRSAGGATTPGTRPPYAPSPNGATEQARKPTSIASVWAL